MEAVDQQRNTVDAHNWIVHHARTCGELPIMGRYYIIRMLHHIHGFKPFKVIDFFYALTWRK